MSVMIKDMEMPTNCTRCPCSDDDTWFCRAANEYIPMLGKPKFCPLAEVEPKRIKGKWIQDNYYDEKYVCDKCGEPCATYIMGKPRDRFCKWCGAEMETE